MCLLLCWLLWMVWWLWFIWWKLCVYVLCWVWLMCNWMLISFVSCMLCLRFVILRCMLCCSVSKWVILCCFIFGRALICCLSLLCWWCIRMLCLLFWVLKVIGFSFFLMVWWRMVWFGVVVCGMIRVIWFCRWKLLSCWWLVVLSCVVLFIWFLVLMRKWVVSVVLSRLLCCLNCVVSVLILWLMKGCWLLRVCCWGLLNWWCWLVW